MRSTLLFSSLVLVTLTATAAAEPTAEIQSGPSEALYSFGMRVGGYGFRSPEGDARNGWDDCRMNGMGAFATRSLGEHAFVETGADLYFAETFPMPAAEGGHGMDRVSGLFTAAGGLRMFPASRVSGYVQLGVGLELTRIELDHAGETVEDGFALPVGFVGFGGDIRVGDRLRLGMNLRAHVMGHPIHDEGAAHVAHDTGDGTAELGGEPAGVELEAEVATQGQFYVSYAL